MNIIIGSLINETLEKVLFFHSIPFSQTFKLNLFAKNNISASIEKLSLLQKLTIFLIFLPSNNFIKIIII